MLVYYTQGYLGFGICPLSGVSKIQNVNTTLWSLDCFLSLVEKNRSIVKNIEFTLLCFHICGTLDSGQHPEPKLSNHFYINLVQWEPCLLFISVRFFYYIMCDLSVPNQ
jgi:hypothetical protein